SRESVNNNLLSSGDASQHTYDSLWKSQAGRGKLYILYTKMIYF
ncbi:unnamed protein product, partial [Rotaria magnacalcarata]